jgi:hypothetical protein
MIGDGFMIRYKIIIPCWHYDNGKRKEGYLDIKLYRFDEEEAIKFANKCDSKIGNMNGCDDWVENNVISDGYITGNSEIIKQEIYEERIK